MKYNGFDNSWLNRILKMKVRMAMTSGNLEPVEDSGYGNHSIFAGNLNDNKGIMLGRELYEKMKHSIIYNSEQTPLYAIIPNSGSDAGDFIFVRK